jgi:hypothetical protein
MRSEVSLIENSATYNVSFTSQKLDLMRGNISAIGFARLRPASYFFLCVIRPEIR